MEECFRDIYVVSRVINCGKAWWNANLFASISSSSSSSSSCPFPLPILLLRGFWRILLQLAFGRKHDRDSLSFQLSELSATQSIQSSVCLDSRLDEGEEEEASGTNNNGGKKAVLNMSNKKIDGSYHISREKRISLRKKFKSSKMRTNTNLNSILKEQKGKEPIAGINFLRFEVSSGPIFTQKVKEWLTNYQKRKKIHARKHLLYVRICSSVCARMCRVRARACVPRVRCVQASRACVACERPARALRASGSC